MGACIKVWIVYKEAGICLTRNRRTWGSNEVGVQHEVGRLSRALQVDEEIGIATVVLVIAVVKVLMVTV